MPLVVRVFSFVPGGAIAASAVFVTIDTRATASFLLALTLVAFGVFLSVRLWRNAVILEPHRVIVRGVLWSRTVPRYRVQGVTHWRWLEWRTVSGHRRFTPLSALWVAGSAPAFIEAGLEHSVEQVNAWARGGSLGADDPGPPRHRKDELDA